MRLVTLKEFHSITLISSSALVWLLERNALPISVDTNSGIMIDIDAVETKKLMHALAIEKETIDQAEYNLLSERAGQIIRENFDTIIEEALQRINQR